MSLQETQRVNGEVELDDFDLDLSMDTPRPSTSTSNSALFMDVDQTDFIDMTQPVAVTADSEPQPSCSAVTGRWYTVLSWLWVRIPLQYKY